MERARIRQGVQGRDFQTPFIGNLLPILSRQVIEDCLRLRQMARTPAQRGAPCRKSLVQQGPHTLAQKIPRMTGIPIGGVLDPDQPPCHGITLQGCARKLQQRANQARSARRQQTLRGHGLQTWQPRTAQQLQQYGFRLIVLMVRQRHPLRRLTGKDFVTPGTSHRFQTFAPLPGHRHDKFRAGDLPLSA